MADPPVNVNVALTGSYTTVYDQGFVIVTDVPSARIAHRGQSATARSYGHYLRSQGVQVFLPPLNYLADFTRRELKSGWEKYTYPGYGWYRSGQIPTLFYEDSPVTPLMRIECVRAVEAKILEKLKNSRVNFAQFFGEAKDTADMFCNSARSIASAVRKVRKGNVLGALKALGTSGSSRQRKKAADAIRREVTRVTGNTFRQAGRKGADAVSQHAHSTWLEMQFGWLPLLQDMEGGAQLLAERATTDPKQTRFHVKAKVQHDIKNLNTYTDVYYSDEETRTTGIYGVFGRFDFFFAQAALASASADGLTNPADLAWQLLPFSFVADYVANIGDYISNLDATAGKGFLGGSMTMYDEWTRDSTRKFSRGNMTGRTGYTESRKRVERYAYGDFPDATLASLTVANPLKNARRIANVVSLLRGAFD